LPGAAAIIAPDARNKELHLFFIDRKAAAQLIQQSTIIIRPMISVTLIRYA
jgi:hypothetical protein